MSGSTVYGIFVKHEKFQRFLREEGWSDKPGEVAKNLTNLTGQRVAIVYDVNSDPGVYICSEVEPLPNVHRQPGKYDPNKSVEYYMEKLRNLFPKTPRDAAKPSALKKLNDLVSKLPLDGESGYYNLYDAYVYWPGDVNDYDSDDDLEAYVRANMKAPMLHDHKPLDLDKLDDLLQTPEFVQNVEELDKKLVGIRDKKAGEEGLDNIA